LQNFFGHICKKTSESEKVECAAVQSSGAWCLALTVAAKHVHITERNGTTPVEMPQSLLSSYFLVTQAVAKKRKPFLTSVNLARWDSGRVMVQALLFWYLISVQFRSDCSHELKCYTHHFGQLNPETTIRSMEIEGFGIV
jgi:hypothetical protein